jgi:hypothetical protein
LTAAHSPDFADAHPGYAYLITIYTDADACPVKQEIYRVAERHAL